MNPGLRVAFLVIALVLVVGFLELLHRGTAAFILSLLKIAAIAIWNMLCNIAAACREFMEYVNRQRS